MKLPLEFYQKLRDSLRISDTVRRKVVLHKKGHEYTGLCPFHTEKTPSFTVNDSKKFYHCFGCGAHGDLIKFVAETQGVGYGQAAKMIAEQNNIEVPKLTVQQAREYEESEYICNILNIAAQFFHSQLNEQVLNYLKQRGLNQQVIQEFNIGYAPAGVLEDFFLTKSIPGKDLVRSGLLGTRDNGQRYEIFANRIIFPIKNIYNKVVGFGGRALSDYGPKYINSPETIVFKKAEIMYGQHIANSYAYKSNYYLLVEGYLDVIALHQYGFRQAVASLGTAVTTTHLQKLWYGADEIVSCLDGDSAGLRASHKLMDMALPLISANKGASFISLPAGADPDQYVKEQGTDKFAKLLQQRKNLSTALWEKECQLLEAKIDNAEERAKLEQRLQAHTSMITDRVLQSNFKSYFKEKLWQARYQKKRREVAKVSAQLLDTKLASPTKLLEAAILQLAVEYPQKYISKLAAIHFVEEEFNEFSQWLANQLTEHPDISNDFIAKEVKNTRFSEIYSLLLSTNNQAKNWLDKIPNNIDIAFDLLLKRHYLTLLKQEYIDISNNDQQPSYNKSLSYLQEIQKISVEVQALEAKLAN